MIHHLVIAKAKLRSMALGLDRKFAERVCRELHLIASTMDDIDRAIREARKRRPPVVVRMPLRHR
jgi:hypothetical protein